MSGSLPASGALTLNMVNTYSGVASGTQVALGGARARLFAGKLTPGSAVSMNDMYNHGIDYTLTLVSPYGNGVVTPDLLLNSYFTTGQLPSGNPFYVTARVAATWNPDDTNPTCTFTKGIAANYVYTRNDRKRYNLQVNYDGVNTIYARGYYTGDSTNFPNGTVYLDRVRLLL